NKGQSITIPKKIRESLSLSEGNEVTISFTNNSRELIIRKLTSETFDNVMVVSQKGSIRIPNELLRLLCLKHGDTFHIYLSVNGLPSRKQTNKNGKSEVKNNYRTSFATTLEVISQKTRLITSNVNW